MVLVCLRVSATRIIRGVPDGFGQHLVGGQHGADQQQRNNDRPRKLGGGEGEVRDRWQRDRHEPAKRVVLQEFVPFECCHGVLVRFSCFSFMRSQ